MRRLLAIAVMAAVGAVALPACHPTEPVAVCFSLRPHEGDLFDYPAQDHATFGFGVYSCAIRHGSTSLVHTYCAYDNGNHGYVKFTCAGPAATQAEADAMKAAA